MYKFDRLEYRAADQQGIELMLISESPQIQTSGETSQKNDTAGSLPHQIADIIRDKIIHDQLAPGAPIRERQLAKSLDVSRTPLRDALKILSQQKLVELIPNRGAVVVENSIEDLADMLLVYSELDEFAGRLACRMATEPDFLRIERHLNQMESATREDDRLKYFNANQAFHLSIVAASRSRTTIELHSNLNIRLYRFRYLAVLENDHWMDKYDNNVKLLKALKARDAEAYASLHKEHFSEAWKSIDDLANREK